MALSIGATSSGFIALFALGLLLTWPSVPWVALTLAGVAFCVIFPIVFYPFSKTLWVATDLLLHGSGSDSSLSAGRRVQVARDVSALAMTSSARLESLSFLPAPFSCLREISERTSRVCCACLRRPVRSGCRRMNISSSGLRISRLRSCSARSSRN
jgi:hypothetical protein